MTCPACQSAGRVDTKAPEKTDWKRHNDTSAENGERSYTGRVVRRGK